MQEEEVTLDQIIEDGSQNTFEVTVSNPNGSSDMHSDNDFISSDFESVPVYKNQFFVRLKTNNYGFQNSWKIENSQGEIVYSKDNFASNTFYSDTITLENGCYKFTLEDTGGDGLDFWYWDALYNDGEIDQPDGSGYINFMYYDTISIFKTFHKDFGSRIVHSFRVQNATFIDEQSFDKFEVYPTQSNGLVHIKSTANNQEKNLQLFDVKGQLLLQKQWFEAETDIDLSNFCEGIYFIKFKTDNSLQKEKIIFNNY